MATPSEQPPPVSTTSLPLDARPLPPRPALVKPPVLASDILREEVAPIAPAQGAARIALACFGVAFACLAAASFFGIGPRAPGTFLGSLGTALVAGLAVVVPAPYAARASMAAMAGLVPLVLGATGEGPLAGVGYEGSLRAGLGLVVITVLPGVLLFRARYRAFRAARMLLAATLLACLPALVWLIIGALNGAAPALARLADGVVATAILTALFGFMGDETTGACSVWAFFLLATHAARLALCTLVVSGSPYGPAGFVLGAVGELAAASIVAFSVFQLLAALLSREARKVDVHRIVGPSAEGERLQSISWE